MGRVRRYTGVEIHHGTIRVSFQYRGIRCRETLGLSPSRANLEHAARLRAEIVDRIRAGSFSYAHYFPSSPALARFGLGTPAGAQTFGQVAKQWLDGQDHLSKSTREGYKKILNTHWMPELWNKPVGEITHAMLQNILVSTKFGTAKTRNNVVSPLNMILKAAFLDELIQVNPADRLRYAKSQRPAPDPLTLPELELILETMPGGPIRSYFELAFFTGMRTSELIALRWEDVDFPAALVRVQRAKVRGEIKGTKTASIRDIELNSRALAALQRQKALTFLADQWVFLDPATGKQFRDDKPPRLHWDRALRRAGIRRRTAYQTRHTYATLHLMAGCLPMWVSRQMGHTNMKMLLERYSRWIDLADKSRERAKIEGIIADAPQVGKRRNKPENG